MTRPAYGRGLDPFPQIAQVCYCGRPIEDECKACEPPKRRARKEARDD